MVYKRLMNSVSPPQPATRLEHIFPGKEEVPLEFRVEPDEYEGLCLYGGRIGRWEGRHMEVVSPIRLRQKDELVHHVIGRVPSMDRTASLVALEAAKRAWNNGRGEWPTMSMEGRIAAIEAFLSRMAALREEAVKLLMWEVGKSLAESRKEFDRTLEYMDRTLLAVRKMSAPADLFREAGITARIGLAPLGICLVMGPFNNPLYETYTTLCPALLMGNTTIVKPPRFGVLVHQLMLGPLAECFPPGVVNVISGNEASLIEPLMESGDIDVLSFVGSSRTANTLHRLHPRPARLRTVFGLDAKNPALIMADADLDETVKECLPGALFFNGQRCTALKIFFVHEAVADAFLERYCAAVNDLPIGLPWSEEVKITPLPDVEKVSSMKAYVDDAVAKGARVKNAGGGTSCETLYFPAVLYPVSAGAAIYHSEQFGPVVPICPYRDEEEVLRFVAASTYGQQVSIFGGDPGKIGRLARELANQTSRVNINCQCRRAPDALPFTGRKDSGNATLSITDTLRCFSIPSVFATPSHGSGEEVLAF